MTDTKEKYQQALAAFAAPGNRWGGIPSLTLWATAAGIDTEAVLADAHAAGVHDRDGDIRRGMSSTTAKLSNVRQDYFGNARSVPKCPLPSARTGCVS